MKRVFILVVLIAVLTSVGVNAAQIPYKSELWFDSIGSPVDLSADDQRGLMKALGNCLFPTPKLLHSRFPDAVLNDQGGRIVYLSLSDGKTNAGIVRGEGVGLADALDCALARVLQLEDKPAKCVAVKLDIVRTASTFDRRRNLADAVFNPGLDGIATTRNNSLALLPDELTANRCFHETGTIRWDVVAMMMAQSGVSIVDIAAKAIDFNAIEYKFTTDSFYIDGKGITKLYRGHMADMPVTQTSLLRTIRAGGDYLKLSVDSKGHFAYNYFPGEDKEGDDYNYVRHAGTVYSMCEVYEITRDPELLAAVRRAFGYLLQKKKINGKTACILSDGTVTSLGANALTALALAKYTKASGDKKYVPLMVQLGNWIEKHQKSSGAFTHYVDTKTGKPTPDTCDYYPGEAAFALTRIAQIDKKAHWLDSVEKAVKYILQTRDSKLDDMELPNDQWMLYSLNEIYRTRPNIEYLKASRRLAKAEMIGQVTKSQFPDESGLLRGKLQSSITAVEGLQAAYLLLRDFGTKEEASIVKLSLQNAIRYQMQIQYQPESALYLPNPRRAVGGVPKSYGNNIVRIDTVQHFLSGCIGYYRVLASEK